MTVVETFREKSFLGSLSVGLIKLRRHSIRIGKLTAGHIHRASVSY